MIGDCVLYIPEYMFALIVLSPSLFADMTNMFAVTIALATE